MSYSALYVRQIGDLSDSFQGAAIKEGGELNTEEWDRQISEPVIATAAQDVIRFENGKEEIETEVGDIKMNVFVTDCRVIYRCDSYDKGGRWRGGLTALALNGIERAAGAVRTRGKSLLGHVRYEWLRALGYVKKTGFFSDNQLYVFYCDENDETHYVWVKLKGSAEVAALANDILHRACRYRLAMTDTNDEEQKEFFEKYSKDENLIEEDSDPKQISMISIPSPYLAPGGEKFRPDWQ